MDITVQLRGIQHQLHAVIANLDGIIDGITAPPPPLAAWAYPVGEGAYPPERWYAANSHTATHTGIDLNLYVSPWGDVERHLGLSVFALSAGIVTYYTSDWSGVPMIVIQHEHAARPVWFRYAHITPIVRTGDTVAAGQRLGGFADWQRGDGGDHLHLDCAVAPFTREWLTPHIPWTDPVPILKAHLDPATVDAMLRRGG